MEGRSWIQTSRKLVNKFTGCYSKYVHTHTCARTHTHTHTHRHTHTHTHTHLMPLYTKINTLFFSFQPVHNMGSSGYGSHGSNGSHEQLVSISSSSESNGNVTTGKTVEETGKAKPPRTFQEICKGVHMLKNQDSQVGLRSPSHSPSPSPSKPEQRKTTDSEFSLISPNRYHFAVALTGEHIFKLSNMYTFGAKWPLFEN